MKKIITMIFMILFILGISNYSNAAPFVNTNWDITNKNGNKKHTIGGIYMAMRNNKESWITSNLGNISNNGWAKNAAANRLPLDVSYGHTYIYSKGGVCVGHQDLGDDEYEDEDDAYEKVKRKVRVIDMNKNTLNDTKLNKLSYAILYSIQNDTDHIGPANGVLNPCGTTSYGDCCKGKKAIRKWVQNNREEMFKDSISNSEFEIKAQAENDGLLALRDLPGLRVKNTNYRSVDDYVDKIRVCKVDKEKTNTRKENGYPRVWRNKNKDGKNYTIIGPYHVTIANGLDDIEIKYTNTSGRSDRTVSAIGVCKNTNFGDFRKMENLSNINVSSDQNFYLVFKEEDMQKVRDIDKIILKQNINYIKARFAYSEGLER